MKSRDFSKKKFLFLSEARQHEKAGELLKEIFSTQNTHLQSTYQKMEEALKLLPLEFASHEEISHRFHLHCEKANISRKEHSLLHVKKKDTKSTESFLPIHIFLSSLRSAFNVGSIFRTVEAFRLGEVYCAPSTPTPDNPKVQKASMGTYSDIICHVNSSIENLPRPWIALETATPSTPLSSFTFPKTFTLILGNEEFGVPEKILSQCDVILEIPLQGGKNSLNVAAAFAIAAAAIRSQQ